MKNGDKIVYNTITYLKYTKSGFQRYNSYLINICYKLICHFTANFWIGSI